MTGKVEEGADSDSNLNTNTVEIFKNFIQTYTRTAIKLQEYADHIPGEDTQLNEDIATIQNNLLVIQDDTLTQAANIAPTTPEEAALLAQLWLEAMKNTSEMSLENQIVVSLCQFIQQLKN